MKNGPLVDDRFSRLWYETGAPFDLDWMGVPVVKSPLDLWMYQEILYDHKPDVVIETGTFMGGSALYMAHIMDVTGVGEIISVDLATDRDLPEHPRIEFLAGLSSTDPRVVQLLAERTAGKKTMVILDSAHDKDHVLDELRKYHKLVTKGHYLIVEDTNVHGYKCALPEYELDVTGGPAEAVKAWQPKNHGFSVERQFERLRFSQNPGGYLRRVN